MRRLASVLKEGGSSGQTAPSGASAAGSDGGISSANQQQMTPATGPVHMGRLQLCGQACRFSPFADDLLAVATAQLFGMAGPGALEVFTLQRTRSDKQGAAQASNPVTSPMPSSADQQARPAAVLQPLRIAVLNHKEAVNDVAWSELNAQTLVGGGGGGAIYAWRLSDPPMVMQGIPAGRDVGGVLVGELKGHTRDIMSLSWSCVDKRLLTSAAVDGHVRVWDMHQRSALRILQHSPTPGSCCCSTSPVDAALVASVGADGRLALHDLRSSSAGKMPMGATWSVMAHPCEVLCVDWMKHRPWQLLTGAADGTVALWDLRKSSSNAVGGPTDTTTANTCRVSSTQAHQLAVRRVASHPFNAQRFASCSYDMHIKIWDCDEGTSISIPTRPDGPPSAAVAAPSPFIAGSGWVRLQGCFDHHREFILGMDWSTFNSGLFASTSWDRSICVWNADTGPAPPGVPKRPLFLSMKVAT